MNGAAVSSVSDCNVSRSSLWKLSSKLVTPNITLPILLHAIAGSDRMQHLTCSLYYLSLKLNVPECNHPPPPPTFVLALFVKVPSFYPQFILTSNETQKPNRWIWEIKRVVSFTRKWMPTSLPFTMYDFKRTAGQWFRCPSQQRIVANHIYLRSDLYFELVRQTSVSDQIQISTITVATWRYGATAWYRPLFDLSISPLSSYSFFMSFPIAFSD